MHCVYLSVSVWTGRAEKEGGPYDELTKMSKNQNKLVANSPAAWPLLLPGVQHLQHLTGLQTITTTGYSRLSSVFSTFAISHSSTGLLLPAAGDKCSQSRAAEPPPRGLNRLRSCESTGRSVGAVSFRSWLSCVRDLEKGGKNEGFDLQKGEFKNKPEIEQFGLGDGARKASHNMM